MALSARQRHLYTHRMEIWAPTDTENATTGEHTGVTYARVATDVPCYFEIRQSVETPATAAGQTESDNAFTRDTIHCAHDLAIDSNYWCKNVTLNPDGSQSQNYGRFWVVVGQPHSVSQARSRRAQKRSVEAIQLQTPPPGVS